MLWMVLFPVLPIGMSEQELSSQIKMQKIVLHFEDDSLQNPQDVLTQSFVDKEKELHIRKGEKVCLAVGSRGIHGIAAIVKSTIAFFHSKSCSVYIVPAMGSHGGGTAAGQEKILESFGISELTMTVPIRSSMETCEVGTLKNGMPIYMSKEALAADRIILINRIKSHTDFQGEIESGLLKMLAIGLGKYEGAENFHRCDTSDFPEFLQEAFEKFKKIPAQINGIGIVENAHERTHLIEVLAEDQILEREKELLQISKKTMARIPLDYADILIVEQIGKELSGAGMDPNVTGRSATPGKFGKSHFKRLLVLDLSEKTHGNASGIGQADLTTKKVHAKIDFKSTYTNILSARAFKSGALPVVLDSDREVIETAIQSCGHFDLKETSIVHIKNTLELCEMNLSVNLLSKIENVDFTKKGKVFTLSFDKNGQLLGKYSR